MARGARVSVPVHVRPAPVADAGEPVTAAPGEPVAFDGSGSTPSDSPLTGYHWTFADGAEAEGAAATHAYERPGLYRAVLRVEDESGHPCDFGSATREVTVNFPPVAEAGEAQSAATGETITLGGGASYDVDGKVATHRWDMGDGTRLDGATVTHAYADPGVYTATLTVTDNSGVANATTTDTVTLTVNAPPVPVATGPDRPIAVGEIAAIDGSASTDADGAILSWSWDFGDGATGRGPAGAVRLGRPRGLSRHPHRHRRQRHPLGRPRRRRSRSPSAPRPSPTPAPTSRSPSARSPSTAAARPTPTAASPPGTGTSATASPRRGRTVRHAYARPGTYEVALVVRDDSGAPLNSAPRHHDRARQRRAHRRRRPRPHRRPRRGGHPRRLGLGRSRRRHRALDLDLPRRLRGRGRARGPHLRHLRPAPGAAHRARRRPACRRPSTSTRSRSRSTLRRSPPPAPTSRSRPASPVRLDGSASYDPDGAIAAWRWDFDDLPDPVAHRRRRAHLGRPRRPHRPAHRHRRAAAPPTPPPPTR